MTRAPVVVAASINNELGSKEFSAVQRLQKAGYILEFLYYLPKVPAEFSMIPSFNEELKRWRRHGTEMLDQLGTKLDIPKSNRHFIDEVLGPDKVFDQAQLYNANIILTHDKNQLKKSLFSRIYDRLRFMINRRKESEVAVENLLSFVSKELGSAKVIPISKKLARDDNIVQERKYRAR